MNPFEPFDSLLHKRAGPIVKYQALGDSYSAGNQAGNAVNSGGGGDNCMRTDGSYAYQLSNDTDVVDQGGSGYRTYIPKLSPCSFKTTSGSQCLSEGVFVQPAYVCWRRRNANLIFCAEFNFLACSGATSTDEYLHQVLDPSFMKDADLYTVTAGGNDINFGDIVKHCVYYLIFGNAQCDSLLKNVADQTADPGTDLGTNLNLLYSALANAKGLSGKAVVLPYVRFYPDGGGTGNPVYCVTGSEAQASRARLNTAVDQLNSQLVAVAKEAGIDIVSPDDLNAAFNGYRFCESNDNTPWLFDEIQNQLQGQTARPAYPPTEDGTASGGLTNPFTNSPLDPGTAATVSGLSSISGIFHPTKDGHTAYEKVLKAHILGQPAPGPPTR